MINYNASFLFETLFYYCSLCLGGMLLSFHMCFVVICGDWGFTVSHSQSLLSCYTVILLLYFYYVILYDIQCCVHE